VNEIRTEKYSQDNQPCGPRYETPVKSRIIFPVMIDKVFRNMAASADKVGDRGHVTSYSHAIHIGSTPHMAVVGTILRPLCVMRLRATTVQKIYSGKTLTAGLTATQIGNSDKIPIAGGTSHLLLGRRFLTITMCDQSHVMMYTIAVGQL
jgi:hypothetical protein